MSRGAGRTDRMGHQRLSGVRAVSALSHDTFFVFYVFFILLILKQIERDIREKRGRCQVSGGVMQMRDRVTANQREGMRRDVSLTPSDSRNLLIAQAGAARPESRHDRTGGGYHSARPGRGPVTGLPARRPHRDRHSARRPGCHEQGCHNGCGRHTKGASTCRGRALARQARGESEAWLVLEDRPWSAVVGDAEGPGMMPGQRSMQVQTLLRARAYRRRAV